MKHIQHITIKAALWGLILVFLSACGVTTVEPEATRRASVTERTFYNIRAYASVLASSHDLDVRRAEAWKVSADEALDFMHRTRTDKRKLVQYSRALRQSSTQSILVSYENGQEALMIFWEDRIRNALRLNASGVVIGFEPLATTSLGGFTVNTELGGLCSGCDVDGLPCTDCSGTNSLFKPTSIDKLGFDDVKVSQPVPLELVSIPERLMNCADDKGIQKALSTERL